MDFTSLSQVQSRNFTILELFHNVVYYTPVFSMQRSVQVKL